MNPNSARLSVPSSRTVYSREQTTTIMEITEGIHLYDNGVGHARSNHMVLDFSRGRLKVTQKNTHSTVWNPEGLCFKKIRLKNYFLGSTPHTT